MDASHREDAPRGTAGRRGRTGLGRAGPGRSAALLAAPLVALALAGCLSASEPLVGAGLLPGLDLPALPALFPGYHTSAAMDGDLRALEAAHPGLVDVEVIGRSVQGRDILMGIVTNEATRNPERLVAFIDGCHHGNELQGCEAPLFVAKFLAENYARNATVRWMLDNFEVRVVPLVNPDGHDLATRTNYNGVNLNRNYPTDHGNPAGLSYPLGAPVTPISSRLPAPWAPQPVAGAVPSSVPFQRPVRPSENGGWAPLDQPEARAIAVQLQRLAAGERFGESDRLAFYLTFHTSVHSVLAPWSAARPPRAIPAEHEAVLDAVLAWTNGHMTYEGGRAGWLSGGGNISYAASGSSQDYAYDAFEVPSFTVETFIPDPEGWPTDANYWGHSSLTFVLFALMNTDRLAAWELPDREFPYPEAWVGVHYFPEGPPGEVRDRIAASRGPREW